MRLKKIKLAGFKSFVDPTTVQFVSNLSAVVGPNGCGKSNVIDAVRWVMGESSAKHLRGGSLTDVIFSGSSARKPVGQATVELLFDNASGKIGGEYANYAEIAIKRLVSRDGQSIYFLNGQRCRRKDVTDIFLGTGLGPRSYAIIEQGMISRVIEAKPDDLRNFLEEAAGISKYKERRRETQNRIQHTQDNLARLNDLRDELSNQLRHLERQSQAAERYKILKTQQEELNAQLAALAWKRLDEESKENERHVRETTLQLEAAFTEYQQLKTQQEKERVAQSDLNEALNEVQKRYYSIGAEVAKIEQTLQHHADRQEQLKTDKLEALQNLDSAQRQLKSDDATIHLLERQIAELEPEKERVDEQEEKASEQELQAELALEEWREKSAQFQQEALLPTRQAEAEKAKIVQLERQIQQTQDRLKRLESEIQQLGDVGSPLEIDALDEKIESLQQQLDHVLIALEQSAQTKEEWLKVLQQTRPQIQSLSKSINEAQGQQAALQTLQESTLGKNNEQRKAWLAQHGLDKENYLAEKIHVTQGWEGAVEAVLGGYLEAISVPHHDLNPLVQYLEEIGSAGINLIQWHQGKATPLTDPNRLAYYVKGSECLPVPIFALLSNVYVAQNTAEAAQMLSALAAHESVITPQGQWLGQGWLKVMPQQEDVNNNLLVRAERLKQLDERLRQDQDKLSALQETLDNSEESLKQSDSIKDQQQQEKNRLQQEIVSIQSERRIKQNRLEQNQKRLLQIQNEITECQANNQNAQQEINVARAELGRALETMSYCNEEQNKLAQTKQLLHDALSRARSDAKMAKDNVHKIAMILQTQGTQLTALRGNISLFTQQMSHAQQKVDQIEQQLIKNNEPIADLNMTLQANLERRLHIEGELNQVRETVSGTEHQLRNIEQGIKESEHKISQIRELLERFKLDWQTLSVRRETVLEKLKNTEFSIEALLAAMPEHANETQWQKDLSDVEQKIQRLGAINLAAIEEFDAAKQRKEYLDAQLLDLTEALTTLENAIKKIDRESRAKFKETFDKVNEGFKQLFPRLFGGGQASLEMTGEDLLDTGISVMARPPGKKNSIITQLSGGEKALTAVALVFAIFQLNPAPFCMLDEVDAPLDDSNVGRFCELVKDMSKTVQFIYISHNKLAIEMAQQLQGVTMREPGVSRLVTVDIEEAKSMAQA